jgi:hypothetical protein
VGDASNPSSLTARELMSFVPIGEAAEMRCQDEKTFAENVPAEEIHYISPRRRAVRLYVALNLAPPLLPTLDHSRAPKPIEPERKLRGIVRQQAEIERQKKPRLAASKKDRAPELT